jgi:protein TonB
VAPPPAFTPPNLSPPLETVRVSPPLPPTVTAQPQPVHTEAPPAKPCNAKPLAAKGRPGDWASDNDYPTRALQLGQEGVTRFRLTVGADGRVSSCDITGTSGSPELDKTTCDLMRRRARFTPAADCDGNPTAGAYPSSVRWQIPKD